MMLQWQLGMDSQNQKPILFVNEFYGLELSGNWGERFLLYSFLKLILVVPGLRLELDRLLWEFYC